MSNIKRMIAPWDIKVGEYADSAKGLDPDIDAFIALEDRKEDEPLIVWRCKHRLNYEDSGGEGGA